MATTLLPPQSRLWARRTFAPLSKARGVITACFHLSSSQPTIGYVTTAAMPPIYLLAAICPSLAHHGLCFAP
jgi:hypothetical protein